jgi:predicted polyphosphate/ATP-dependent NAD kinase
MRLGLIVNPVAGLGGPAAFRGSDDVEQQRLALARGIAPRAFAHAQRMLASCASAHSRIAFVTWGGAMGEDALRAAGLRTRVLGASTGPTTGEDTRRAVAGCVADGIDLLLLAGGDGTVRDALSSIPAALPVLGIPAGVKMRSGIFAVTPEAAGAVIVRLVDGGLVAADLAQVQDVEDAVPRSYGELKVPRIGSYLQHLKVGGRESQALVLNEIATWITEMLHERGGRAVLGPGSTTFAVKERLRVDGTLHGVDVVEDGALRIKDADAAALEAVVDAETVLVVSFSRGQGFLFGRGNQQLSATVVRRIPRDHRWVIGSRAKLASLEGRGLRVDTGDPALDRELIGLVEVITGYDDACYHRID